MVASGWHWETRPKIRDHSEIVDVSNDKMHLSRQATPILLPLLRNVLVVFCFGMGLMREVFYPDWDLTLGLDLV